MQQKAANGPDWRDAAAYAPLLEAERALFAWEWLRRDPDYRAAATAGIVLDRHAPGASPKRFGLVAFEPPHVSVPDARPVWRAGVLAAVLHVDVALGASAGPDAVDLRRLDGFARLITGGAVEHLLLSDGLRTVRLDGPRDTFTSGPVCLRYRIEGLARAEAPLLTLRRFLALSRTGCFARLLHGREARARRWILLLRAWDGLVAGADQRQLAEILLSGSVSRPRWRSREPSVRSQVQRLVRAARAFAAGGYRALLASDGAVSRARTGSGPDSS